MVELVALLVAYVVGFALPGWFAARLLDVRPLWCGAFAISWLNLVCGVILLQLVGLPLTFFTITVWQLIVAGILFALWQKFGPLQKPATAPEGPTLGRSQLAILQCAIGVIVVLGFFRFYMAPLVGGDVPIRYELLADVMLSDASLDMYPPARPSDYTHYFLADYIPPVVSAGYWFLYAGWGEREPLVTIGFVLAQWLVTIGFAYRLGANIAGNAAGWFAAAGLAGSSFVFSSIAIGQDVGATCMGVTGSLAVLTEKRDINWYSAVAASLVAGVGVMVREYGPLIAIAAGLPLLWPRTRWKYLAASAALVVGLLALWYVRNLVRLGNPFHSLSLPGFEPASPVYASLMSSYGDRGVTASAWKLAGLSAIHTMPLLITAGPVAAIWLAKKRPSVVGAMVVVLAVWLVSIPYVAGGLAYSMRTAAPAMVLAAVAIGVALASMANSKKYIWAASSLMVVACVWGSIYTATFPQQLGIMQLGRLPDFVGKTYEQGGDAPLVRQAIQGKLPEGARMLSFDAYAHAALRRGDVEVIPYWSPEFSFAFDDQLSRSEIREQLHEREVTHVMVNPGSLNQRWLMNQPYFAKDLLDWAVVAEGFGGRLIVLAIPPRGESPAADEPSGDAALP